MILGAEIGLTIMGLIALCRGTLSVGKNKVVTGWRARLLGGIAMFTLPMALFIGIVYGIVQAVQGNDVSQINPLSLIWIDLLAIGSVLIVVTILGKMFFNSQQSELSNFANAQIGVSPSSGQIDPSNPYSTR